MRLIDADELKTHKYHSGVHCENAVAVYHIDNAPTVKAVTIERLEEMYEEFQSALWREREDVRGADMIEIGYAELFLQELLCMFGCWDEEEEDENQNDSNRD